MRMRHVSWLTTEFAFSLLVFVDRENELTHHLECQLLVWSQLRLVVMRRGMVVGCRKDGGRALEIRPIASSAINIK
jgi:hypothetical protein